MLIYILIGLCVAQFSIIKFKSIHFKFQRPWTPGVIIIIFAWPAFVLPPCWEWVVDQAKFKLG